MRVTLLFIIAFLGFGCAAKKIVVDNADTLLSYQVQKTIPLNESQEKEFDLDVAKFLNQSKPLAREIVPVIDQLKLDTETNAEYHYQQLENFVRKLAKDFSALMSKYLAKLNENQQAELFANLSKENEKILKKDKQKRQKEHVDRFKMFMGSISPEQINILKSYNDYYHDRNKLRVENRKKLHEEFKSIYKEKLTSTERENKFQEAFLRYQDNSFAHNKNLEIIQKLLPTITDKQREAFRQKTQEIKELLNYFIQTDY